MNTSLVIENRNEPSEIKLLRYKYFLPYHEWYPDKLKRDRCFFWLFVAMNFENKEFKGMRVFQLHACNPKTPEAYEAGHKLYFEKRYPENSLIRTVEWTWPEYRFTEELRYVFLGIEERMFNTLNEWFHEMLRPWNIRKKDVGTQKERGSEKFENLQGRDRL